ncbi:MAG TPA: hypothetical protein DEP42_04200 [Ruminococcaceae bacterium]|nr:hypothetical protein [Oscillospiraceae bacterium]
MTQNFNAFYSPAINQYSSFGFKVAYQINLFLSRNALCFPFISFPMTEQRENSIFDRLFACVERLLFGSGKFFLLARVY